MKVGKLGCVGIAFLGLLETGCGRYAAAGYNTGGYGGDYPYSGGFYDSSFEDARRERQRKLQKEQEEKQPSPRNTITGNAITGSAIPEGNGAFR